jgi:hypothetical protein
MAEELPKLLKTELIEHSAVKISDWVKDALEKRYGSESYSAKCRICGPAAH